MNFIKLESCSNDYCIIKYQDELNFSELAIKLCNRLTGIGASGIIFHKENTNEVLFYNELGESLIMSSFSIYSFAKYYSIINSKLKNKWSFMNNGKEFFVEGTNNSFKVKVSKPNFSNQSIYVGDLINSFGRILTVEGYHLTIYAFSVDNPQLVIFVDSLDSSYINIAKEISENRLFRKGINVHFVKKISDIEVSIKSYINRKGFVLSSDEGAAASIVCGHKLGILDNRIKVNFEYGSIMVSINKKSDIILEGTSNIVFEGEIKGE